MSWEPLILDERLAEDHPARTIWAVAGRLDLSAFHEPIAARGDAPGRAATDPRLLVALWLYAAVEGLGNGRELARLCGVHDAYRWLCGGFAPAYNVQIATDPSSRAIVGVEVTNHGTDHGEDAPLRKQVEDRTGG